MSNYYWIENYSSDVNSASNWSLYPLTGATLPPAAEQIPGTGDMAFFMWSNFGATSGQPLYHPEGTLSGSLSLVSITPDFEMDIGSSAAPLGLSSDNILVFKKYQSNPNKGTLVPSVYINSNGNNTYLTTSMWGDAPVPSSFGNLIAPQCTMQFNGTIRAIDCGGVQGANPETRRSEYLIFGNESSTTIGGYDAGEYTLNISPTARTTINFGPYTSLITPDISGTSKKETIDIKGENVKVEILRGADFSSNCGGIKILSSSLLNSGFKNMIHFVRSGYEGATGFNQSIRTTVKDFKMNAFASKSKYDPEVLIEHGVDFTGDLVIASGKFKIDECQEDTRTYGSAASAQYVGDSIFSNCPRVELASNCSIRNIKIEPFGQPIDFVAEPSPLKTLFINQPMTEGYTGL